MLAVNLDLDRSVETSWITDWAVPAATEYPSDSAWLFAAERHQPKSAIRLAKVTRFEGDPWLPLNEWVVEASEGPALPGDACASCGKRLSRAAVYAGGWAFHTNCVGQAVPEAIGSELAAAGRERRQVRSVSDVQRSRAVRGLP